MIEVAIMTPQKHNSISMLVSEFISHKEKVNRRPQYLQSLRSYLGRFMKGRESEPVSSVTPELVEEWFAHRNETPAAQCAAIGRLSSFFTFCERRRYIESNPMRRIERPYVERKAPIVLTPAEARSLLITTRDHRRELLGYITLGLFCGIRPFEMVNMTWLDISTDPRDIKDLKGYGVANVAAAASKVRRRRIVPIHPAALQWLALCKPGGNLVTYSRTHPVTTHLAELAGLTWSHDLLRHSAASYMMALYEDSGRVAHWLGNSPQILLTHYYQVIQPDDCAAFWSITP